MSPAIALLPGSTLSPAQRTELIGLCTRAYEEDFAPYFQHFGEATHVVATVAGRAVSHALWVARRLDYAGQPLRTAYVEAVATEPAEQGRGYATAVLRALAAALAAQDADYELAALAPSDPAFYARLGWDSWRGPLYARRGAVRQPTPDEEVMILRLPRTPPLDLTAPLTAPWRTGDVW